MKTIPNLLLAAFLLSSFGVMEAGAAPDAQDGGLPALINAKEKGVFHLRVLNKQGQEISSGTGFLVDGKGTLVTALHMILPKQDVVGAVEAMDADGKTWKVEGVTASDSSVDLAVLKLEKVPDAARPLTLAGDGLPVRGAKVLVLGHPQGFQFVATDGIVSATHKTDHLPEPLRQSGFIHSAPDVVWIQTTAAVSNGNSGGPLLNESGDVIGMVQWMARGQGMNFALQVASIRKVLDRPAQLQTLQAFTEPEADFFTLMKDFQMDQMKAQQRDFAPFGFPGQDEKKPKAKGDPLLEKYVPALLALATKHRDKDVELQSLMILMNLSSRSELPPEIAGDVKKAADRLLGKFRDDRRLLSFVRSPFTPTLPEAREFVFSLSKASSDPEIRALAALMSARCVDLNAIGGDSLKTAMEFARAAAKCPPGIMYGPESVAEVAGKLIDMLEHSSVGCAAPELEGIDQDGKPVKLSALKGRHVVVAFYTAENEFRAGIAGELNDLVKYADGRPLSVIGVLVEFPNRFFTSSGQREVKKTWASIKDGADGTLREAWHISDAPTVFLIDPKSVIKSRYTERPKETGMGFMNMFGGMNRSESDWKRHLMDALKGTPELETEADKAADKEKPAAAGNTPKAGEVKFSDWLKTVRFRNEPDDGSSLFVEGDFMVQTNTKGARRANLSPKIQRIDEERQTVYWENNGRVASLSINPDRMRGLRVTVGGVRIRVTVIQGKNATGKPAKESQANPLSPKEQDALETLRLLAEASTAKPEDTSLAMKVAALQVWFGKDADHAATRQRMLTWAADTEKADAAERVAKLACLRPIADAKAQEAALDLARKAAELGKENKQAQPWYQMTLGMAEYRSGHHQEAETVLSALPGTIGKDTYRAGHIAGIAAFYRAMSLFQLGRQDEASALLTATKATMRPLPEDEKDPLADKAHHDDLILWLACREAEKMLGFATK